MEANEKVAKRSRRAVLAAAAGAAAASLARPLAAAAATGDPLILGQENVSDDSTTLKGTLYLNNLFEGPEGGIACDTASGAAVLGRAIEGVGVYGQTSGTAGGTASVGVRGSTTSSQGIAVVASAGGGATGLHVTGKAKFPDRSGRATIATGHSYVDVDLVSRSGLHGTPLCFANLMSNRSGVYVRAVRPNYPSANKLRIYLNKAVTSSTHVAWLVLG